MGEGEAVFNPLEHRGIALDEQVRDWREMNVKPIDPEAVDPYTRCQIITMNGIELEAIWFNHQFARHCPDDDLRRKAAYTRHIEAQQQRVVNWLLPGVSSVLETTLAYEQVAVDLTAWVARHEPDDYLRQAYEFGVLEDFDHLYRYANLYEMVERRKAEKIVDQLTEVMPGRPTTQQHRHPYDNVRTPYDGSSAAVQSKLNALTVFSAEQQTMNFYMNVGPQYMAPIARQLYQEISMVEEEHVTHYGSLMDPNETWWARLLIHEYNECYLYYSFMRHESDPRVKAVWELHLEMEIAHLRQAADWLRRMDGREPEEVVGDGLPEPVTFEPNKTFIRDLIATQLDLTTLGAGYVREAHERFQQMQQRVNAGQKPPSEVVIDEHRRQFDGEDYRIETDGRHPVEALRALHGASVNGGGRG